MVWRDDDLADFDARRCTFEGKEKTVYVSGSGPAVLVMAEMPGVGPQVIRFARWVRDAGLTVYLPSLFGRDGAVPDAEEAATIFRAACISAEFRALGGGQSSPVANWLRALAREAHHECGGRGVGAIGMCFTGNFAVTLLLEPSVIAAVLAQPALPLDNPAGIEASAQELEAVRQRIERDDIEIPAYRFAGDHFCRAERFAAYAEALGPHFKPHVLADDSANSDVPPFTANFVPTPHSVFTAHLIDAAGEPTAAARDAVVAYFRDRLLG
ncbi:dienelactone hydrolase family protein [Sphingomonas jaspsi]|uniref:dienelactone hydrolase family protein n=1 Tax=Sphingomonas jaspsi TaxID=392409 RepID=UPI0004BCFDB5|nr:dienelactone hydrolase family protein [Sphingomonas jaspsi]